jgi:hypothetical protein
VYANHIRRNNIATPFTDNGKAARCELVDHCKLIFRNLRVDFVVFGKCVLQNMDELRCTLLPARSGAITPGT